MTLHQSDDCTYINTIVYLSGMEDNNRGICPKCGTQNEPGSLFCRNCGAKLDSPVRYCTSCGRPLPSPSTAVCPACGAVQSRPVQAPVAPLSVQAPVQQNYSVMPQQPVSVPGGDVLIPPSAADFDALRRIRRFGLIGIVEAVISIILLSSGMDSVIVPAVGKAAALLGLSLLAALVVIADIGLYVYAVYQVRSAFRLLSRQDSRFSTPASLVNLLLLSISLIGVVFILLFAALAAHTVGAVLLLAAVILILAVVAVVGVVGLLLGLWRLGSRYRDDAMKVAAILFIIPFLSVVGAILVFASSNSLLKRMKGS